MRRAAETRETRKNRHSTGWQRSLTTDHWPLGTAKNGQPRQDLSRRGCRDSAIGLISRILFFAVIPLGAALPRTLFSDLPGGFDHCMEQTCDMLRRRKAPLEPSERAGPARRAGLALGPRVPPYLVLLRVGFTLPPTLRPERCALTAPFHPYHCVGQPLGLAPPHGGIFSVALAVHGP